MKRVWLVSLNACPATLKLLVCFYNLVYFSCPILKYFMHTDILQYGLGQTSLSQLCMRANSSESILLGVELELLSRTKTFL